jgi:diguanylate cyclase (GGDEF)-like protein
VVVSPESQADAAAGGLASSRPPADLERRDRAEARLRALSEIGRAAMVPGRDEAVEAVVRAARLALGGASISLGVWEPDARVLRTMVNEGELADWEETRPVDETYPADQSTWLAGMVGGHLGLTMTRDDPDLPADERQYLELLDKHSSLTVPLLKHGEWWGELFVARRVDQPSFGEADLDWASAVAAQVAAALEAADQLARSSELARTDALTGLANRLAVNEWMTDATARWRDEHVRVGLVVCDVNGLKQVNDTDGHEVGDRLLVQFAAQLKDMATSHGVSLLARLGGDEFCAAFVDVDEEAVVDAAEEICRRGWDSLPMGVAVGVAVTGADAGPVESGSQLFRLADAAQYRAKHTGSRHPVVSGRSLPEDAVAALVRTVPLGGQERRLLRGNTQRQEVARLVEVSLRALDDAGEETTRSRLALVGDLVAQHVDAAGWWLSLVLPGDPVLRTAQFAVLRGLPGLSRGDLAAEMGGTFPLDQYAPSARALGGGSFHVRSGAPYADPGEQETLDALGASAVAAAGVTEADGTAWLLEVFGDGLTAPLHAVAPVLRLLVLAAVHPPVAPPGGDAGPGPG